MKKTLLISVTLLLFISSYAQDKNRASFGLSYNKFEIAYRHSFTEKQVWLNPFFGISNQDINSNFNDFILGLKIGLPILKFQKSNIYGQLNSGFYFPNNDYYRTTTPFIGIDLGYEMLLGKNKKHSIFAEIGYLYGQSKYTQNYSDDFISISSTETFTLSPLNFNIGYGFYF